jgi:hypothetical protein
MPFIGRTLCAFAGIAFCGCSGQPSVSAPGAQAPAPETGINGDAAQDRSTTSQASGCTPPTLLDADRGAECAAACPGSVRPPVRFAGPTLLSGCGLGVNDGSGLFAALPSADSAYERSYQFVPLAGGAAIHNVTSVRGSLLPQPSGYQWAPAASVLTPPEVRAGRLTLYDDEGAVVSTGGTKGWVYSLQAAPGGGSVATTIEYGASGAPHEFWRLELVDTTGTSGASFDIGGAYIAVAAINTDRWMLAYDSARRLRWLDDHLIPVTDWFAPSNDWDTATALADGAVAFSYGGQWAFAVANGVSSSTQPPDWLAAHPGAAVQIVRNGGAYAIIAPWPNCHQTPVEIVLRDGTSCGSLQLGTDACNVSIGYDGTLFEVALDTTERVCTWEWWPRLLQ